MTIASLTRRVGVASLLCHAVAHADVTEIRITPKYETAGIIIATDQAAATIEYRKATEATYRPGHPFVRFDDGHMATSLFGLTKDTEYAVRINGTSTHEFRTLPDFAIPEPLRIVNAARPDELRDALANAVVGDEIRVAPGTYVGEFTIAVSGSREHPIVIRGQAEASEMAKPIQERLGLPLIDANGANHAFLVDGGAVPREHIVFDGLRITGGKKSGIRLYASRKCVVQNCQVHDNDQGATTNGAQIDMIGGGEDAGRHLIQCNHIADLTHPPFEFSAEVTPGVTYYGIYAYDHPGWGTTIRGNRIEGQVDGYGATGDEGDAASVSETATDILAHWQNREMDIYDNIFIDHRDDAIEADGIVVNQRIFRNRMENSENAISVAPLLPGPVFIVCNVAIGYHQGCVKLNTAAGRGIIRNIYFYHNTWVRTDDIVGSRNMIMNIYDGTPSDNLVFRNNLFQGNHRCVYIQSGRTHNPDFDHNLWWTPYDDTSIFKWEGHSAGRFADYWQAVLGEDPHGHFADPHLDADLMPGPGSPAIDAGIAIPGINDDHRGERPDIGAFEHEEGDGFLRVACSPDGGENTVSHP
jgi:hypothetical protein